MDRFSFAVKVAKGLQIDNSLIQKVDSNTLYENTKARLGFAAKRGKYLRLQNNVPVSQKAINDVHFFSRVSAKRH